MRGQLMNHSIDRPALEALTISKHEQEELALNHEKLYLAGIDYVRQYCGRSWTDYNTHDPGVTILELLSYALTDAGHKASYPIADLLASGSGESDLSSQFNSASQLFNNAQHRG